MLKYCKILGLSNNITWILKQKNTTNWTPVSWETNVKSSGPDDLMNSFQVGAITSLVAWRWVCVQTVWWPDYKLLIRWSDLEHFISVSRLTEDQLVVFFCSSIQVLLFDNTGMYNCLNTLFLLSPHLCFIFGFIGDLLAHLSTKSSRWAIVIGQCPSCVVHRPSCSVNNLL